MCKLLRYCELEKFEKGFQDYKGALLRRLHKARYEVSSKN